MKTTLLSLMLLLSTSIFADMFTSDSKIWGDVGGIIAPSGPIFIAGGSLNYQKKTIHYKLKAGAEHYGDDNYMKYYHIDILAGKQFTVNDYMNISLLTGLGVINIEKSPYDLEQDSQRFFTTFSIPIELEFMVHLKYVGVGFNLYYEFNTVSQLVGANFKIAFGNM